MTQCVTFLRGLSASGKSSIAKAMAAHDGTVRVNMDDIRETLGLPFSKDAERLALDIQDQIVLRALRAGHDVVVDNVHLHDKWPRRIVTMIWESGLDVEYDLVDLMDQPESVCIERNLARISSGNIGVPDHVIPKQAKDWAKQVQKGPWTIESITAGFPVIEPYVEPSSGFHKRVPDAIIVDVDGTLARSEGRSPYEFDRLAEDRVHDHVSSLVSVWSDFNYDHTDGKVIILTGRDAQYRDLTSQWLQDHAIPYDELWTRAAGDTRRDSIVKLELFNEHIRDHFKVRAVFDDRLRVVRMWHALGLPVFRVGDPDADF